MPALSSAPRALNRVRQRGARSRPLRPPPRCRRKATNQRSSELPSRSADLRPTPWLTSQSAANRSHPVTPCFPLLCSEKQAIFPSCWIDLRSTFFQVLSTFPLVMVFSLRCKNCDHSSAKQGYFLNVSGTLDLITGENSKRLRKRQLRSSPLLSLTLRSAMAQGAPGRLPCPRTNMGSAGPSGPSAGRQASKTKDFLTRIPPAVTLIRVSPREWQWQRL